MFRPAGAPVWHPPPRPAPPHRRPRPGSSRCPPGSGLAPPGATRILLFTLAPTPCIPHPGPRGRAQSPRTPARVPWVLVGRRATPLRARRAAGARCSEREGKSAHLQAGTESGRRKRDTVNRSSWLNAQGPVSLLFYLFICSLLTCLPSSPPRRGPWFPPQAVLRGNGKGVNNHHSVLIHPQKRPKKVSWV